MLTAFPQGIQFKYSWRKYQQRVLDELDNHINDRHLHVVAPPGSGKTILGLEVMLRLNAPTLILAPTVAIRNQWIHRFCDLFLQSGETPGWISRDIRNPGFLTVVTYQGLHAACTGKEIIEDELDESEENGNSGGGKITKNNISAIIKGLEVQQVKTIVVDEAHHLKKEWWNTLTKIKKALDPVIVGLTATPPYDVPYHEWSRYLELNGPVDAEISVPELIKEGDLCPHQDYIYFCTPSRHEEEKIKEILGNISALFEEIKNDTILLEAVLQHSAFVKPEVVADWIYDNIGYYSSILIFLNSRGIKIPKSHFELIGNEGLQIPPFNYDWAETLLEFYLFKEEVQFEKYIKHRKTTEAKLRSCGVLEHQKINFNGNKSVTGLLTSSISKLNGIKEITDFEYAQLGDKLRLVILTDYIRKEFLIAPGADALPLNKIGVIPIFEKLRRENTDNKKLGVLTGSLIILPVGAKERLRQKLRENGVENSGFVTLQYDPEYIVINPSEKLKHHIVKIITGIFEEGYIEVLIGTKSLLGEGWDAPAVNALILASFVGSFVLSNQMRGRAIRTQRGNGEKTGNVWHLVCIDMLSEIGGKDLDIMRRRFKTFVGVSVQEPVFIESGVERLDIPDKIVLPEIIDKKNKQTFELAANRETLKNKWQIAISKGLVLTEEIKLPFPEAEKSYKQITTLYYKKTIRNLIAELGFGIMFFGENVIQALARSTRYLKTLNDLYAALSIIGVTGFFIFGRKLYQASTLYFKYRDISKDIKNIGDALLLSLIEAGVITTPRESLMVAAAVDNWGAVYCHLEGGSTFEKSTFISALQEIIQPVENPRYLIVRKSKKMKVIHQNDYHSVPELLGKKKNLAEHFNDMWRQWVGRCELVYTRFPEGRKLLLKARMNSLSAQLEEKIERVNKWR